MVASAFFDLVLPDGEQPDRAKRIATELLQSSLSEITHIECLDESLAPSDPASFDRRTIALLRDIYETWAKQAESLITHLSKIERLHGPLPGVDDLKRAHGRTRAMLSISLDALERGHRDAVAGRTTPIAEVRRELRLGTH